MPHPNTSAQTAAIVLGGGLKKVQVGDQPRYEPHDQARARLDVAYALFLEGKADILVLTGKYGPRARIDPDVSGPQTEAEVGVAYLVAKANASARAEARRIEDSIVYEKESMDTIGNAWYAKKRCLEPLDITSCILVTSDYHMPRARLIFEWVLGSRYTLTCADAPSPLTGAERERRDRFERTLIDFVQTRLVSTIPPGDDEAITHFIENELPDILLGDILLGA